MPNLNEPNQISIEQLNSEQFRERIPDLEHLFNASFGRKLQPGYLEWRYLSGIHPEPLAIIARSGENVVASYTASIVDLRWRNQSVRSALSMTTMTHPSFTQRGLFTTLATNLNTYMAGIGLDFIWGFPNHHSRHGFETHLGWRMIGEIETATATALQVLQRCPGHDETTVPDRKFTLDYSNCMNLQPDQLHVTKTVDYLRWRYMLHPIHDYSNLCLVDRSGLVRSYCVFKEYQPASYDIVDLQSSDTHDAICLIRAVAREVAANPLASLNIWSPSEPTLSAYTALGFGPSSNRTLLGWANFSSTPNEVVPSSLQSWYLQMGDSDVY